MSRKYRAKICAVAREYGETPQQVRKEMQETIRIAYESDDPEVRAAWAKTPFSACPTVEEFLS